MESSAKSHVKLNVQLVSDPHIFCSTKGSGLESWQTFLLNEISSFANTIKQLYKKVQLRNHAADAAQVAYNLNIINHA